MSNPTPMRPVTVRGGGGFGVPIHQQASVHPRRQYYMPMNKAGAAFVAELSGLPLEYPCFTPRETRLSHALQSAALDSNRKRSVERVVY